MFSFELDPLTDEGRYFEWLMDTGSAHLGTSVQLDDLIITAQNPCVSAVLRWAAVSLISENIEEWSECELDHISYALNRGGGPVCPDERILHNATGRLIIWIKNDIASEFECPLCGHDKRVGSHGHQLDVDDFRCYPEDTREPEFDEIPF